MHRFVLISAILIAVGLFLYNPQAHSQVQAENNRIAKGTVERAPAEKGETPGWQIRLEDQLYLGDQLYDTIEIYLPEGDLFQYAGKRVVATGTYVQWRTPERGKYIVLEICEITVIE